MNEVGHPGLESRVLLVPATVEDGERLRTPLAHAGIDCLTCPDQALACAQLTAGAGVVVIAQACVHSGPGPLSDWLARQPLWSDLPVLLLTGAGADAAAVAQAVDRLGNVTVLAWPTQAGLVVSAVRTALRARQRQYQVREALAQYPRVAGPGEALRDSEPSRRASFEPEAAERMQREGKDQFIALADAAPAMLWVTKADASLQFISRGWLDYTGQTEAEAFSDDGFGWLNAVHPDDRAQSGKVFLDANQQQQMFSLDYRIRRADGGYRWAIDAGRPRRAADGQFLGYVGSVIDVHDLKLADGRLRQSEARLRRVFESNVTGMIRWDLDRGLILDANAEFFRMTGYAPEDLANGGLNFRDLTPPEWTDRNEANIQRLRTDGFAPPYEKEYFRKDGSRVPFIIAGTRFDDSPSEGMSFLIDISDRKQAEVARQLAVGQYRSLVEGNPALICRFQPDGRLTYVNDTYCRVFGRSRESLIGKTFMPLIPDEDKPTVARMMERLAPGMSPATLEHRVILADGQIRWQRWTNKPVVDDAGNFTEFLAIGLDITERQHAEEALRDNEARLSGILRRSPAGIVQTDAGGCMTLVNLRWCEMLGHAEADLLGRSILEITHPTSVAETATAFARLAAGGPDFQIEKAYRRKDGSVLRAQSNIAALRSPQGVFLGLIAVVLDISDRLRAEEELRRLAAELSEADRRKDVFMATLAHELRNPLAPIRHGLQVMKLASSDGQALEQARDMMDRQLSLLVRLVDDLLDVSRITQGKVELRMERIELKAVIDAALETSRPAIVQAGHELTVVLPDEPAVVHGDATRLAQVVANLLLNAAKYTRRGGHVRLMAERQDDTVVVSVKDNGIGIPAGMLGRVFEMFTQVDRSLERTTGGLGIGLSLVKGLLEMHGGTVEAHSEGEGLGSEFVVRLPVVVATAGQAGAAGQQRDAAPSDCRRILVVDDNVDAADSLGQLLELMGHQVQTANDGEAAIAAAAQFRPDVVLMDIGMPKLNGYGAARHLRQQPWGRDMALVALTGWGQESDRQRSAEAGFDAHLVKPVALHALTTLLSRLPRAGG